MALPAAYSPRAAAFLTFSTVLTCDFMRRILNLTPPFIPRYNTP